MAEMRAHVCAATLCKLMISERFPMCRSHWALVPAQIQGRVYETYRKRARNPNAYWDAVNAAVEAVRTYG